MLDFKTCGIYIYDSPSYSLTNNITGGIIRTAYGISGNRADFTPTAGTIELYGASDAGISQSNGCTFWDVNINKSAKNASLASRYYQFLVKGLIKLLEMEEKPTQLPHLRISQLPTALLFHQAHSK